MRHPTLSYVLLGLLALALVLPARTTFAQGNKPGAGGGAAPVVVTNTPLPVTGTVALAGTPVQLLLIGLFDTEGGINLGDTVLGPRSYTIPEGFSRLLMRHVSCRAIVPSGQKVQIFLGADFDFGSMITPGELIELIPQGEIAGALPQPRQVAHADMYAFLGVATPGGPTIGRTLRLNAQRDAVTGTGSVTCTVGGELQR